MLWVNFSRCRVTLRESAEPPPADRSAANRSLRPVPNTVHAQMHQSMQKTYSSIPPRRGLATKAGLPTLPWFERSDRCEKAPFTQDALERVVASRLKVEARPCDQVLYGA